jgi:hypothetical protein
VRVTVTGHQDCVVTVLTSTLVEMGHAVTWSDSAAQASRRVRMSTKGLVMCLRRVTPMPTPRAFVTRGRA